MAEISESPVPDDYKKASEQTTELSDFDPEKMRKTKPGAKRLIITCTVLLSFLIGLPFLLKSVEIYRSPLPFPDIDLLSAEIDSSRILFPCHFHVVFVNFTSISESAEQLRHAIHAQEQLQPAHCGTCNSTVAVTLDTGLDCITDNRYAWKCKVLNEFNCDRNLRNCDEELDEFLDSVLKNFQKHEKEKVYTVVVVNRNDADELRGVVGKHRHAWIEGRSLKEAEVVERIAEIFIKVFVNGGKEDGSVHGEFMPVGADERVVLSFSLLNADPLDWLYDWDFQEMEERLLAPVVDALKPLADVSVESQVLYHTPKSSHSYYNDKVGGHLFSTQDLPFFVNSNEWHLDTSIAAGGRSKVLQFVVYIPSVRECPLLLQLPNGDFSSTNGFISPMWGGVVVWNPPSCSIGLQHAHHPQQKISPDDLKKIFEVFLGQLRQLFGLNSNRLYSGSSGTFLLLASESGFTEWELDVLSRQHTCFNLLQIGRTLGSLSRLVQSLPRMIIKDEIGKQVRLSLEAAKLALNNASLGIYDASAVLSRHSRSFAEDAFYHPSMMSVSYYSFEHCFAVYSPFFLPVSLHVLLAVLKELKRYKKEQKKYTAWKSKLSATAAS